MLYYYPKLVRKNNIKKNKLSPDVSSQKIITYEKSIKKAWLTEELSKSGIIGDPRNASALKGEKISNIVIDCIKKIIDEMYN